MSRMRGTLKKKTAKLAKSSAKASTKKLAKGSARRARRERDDDDEESGDARDRFGPPPASNNTGLIMAIVGVLAVVLLVAVMAGGSGSSVVDEHEAEKAFNLVDGKYALARGGDALTENRAALRQAFQSVADQFPGTEAGEKALRRVRELQ